MGKGTKGVKKEEQKEQGEGETIKGEEGGEERSEGKKGEEEQGKK